MGRPVGRQHCRRSLGSAARPHHHAKQDDQDPPMTPTLRKPFGVIAIVIGICIYAALVASAAPWIERLHVLAQTPVYLVLGIIWILPLKPLLRGMETGSWKTRSEERRVGKEGVSTCKTR